MKKKKEMIICLQGYKEIIGCLDNAADEEVLITLIAYVPCMTNAITLGIYI